MSFYQAAYKNLLEVNQLSSPNQHEQIGPNKYYFSGSSVNYFHYFLSNILYFIFCLNIWLIYVSIFIRDFMVEILYQTHLINYPRLLAKLSPSFQVGFEKSTNPSTIVEL